MLTNRFDLTERIAEMDREAEAARHAITEADVLAALDPNGATMKHRAVIAQVKSATGYSEYALRRPVNSILARLRKAGRVELIKGPGSGWRLTGLARPRIGAVER